MLGLALPAAAQVSVPTPGAIGYIDEADAGAHLHILLRK